MDLRLPYNSLGRCIYHALYTQVFCLSALTLLVQLYIEWSLFVQQTLQNSKISLEQYSKSLAKELSERGQSRRLLYPTFLLVQKCIPSMFINVRSQSLCNKRWSSIILVQRMTKKNRKKYDKKIQSMHAAPGKP